VQRAAHRHRPERPGKRERLLGENQVERLVLVVECCYPIQVGLDQQFGTEALSPDERGRLRNGQFGDVRKRFGGVA
jgi:hypothetical protein